jgi:hypothetical protein
MEFKHDGLHCIHCEHFISREQIQADQQVGDFVW